MRCKTIGCVNIIRNPNRADCWRIYQMCNPCCRELGLGHKTGGFNPHKCSSSNKRMTGECLNGRHEHTKYIQHCHGKFCSCKCHGEIVCVVS